MQMDKRSNNISIATAAGGTDDPEHAVIDNQRPPDSSGNAKINHPPLHDQSEVVLLEKNTMSKEMIEPAVLQYEHYAIFPAITKMEAQKVDEQIYVVKIVFNKTMGAMGKVQRAVEMLNDFHCINVTVSEYDQHHMQSSNFLRVKKTKGSLLAMDEDAY
ncbi:hypothetical protein C5167_044315 [Papaver somniferum]|uniref:Uncharacterized protein n=1 Tax=Papaver somniferum TaxID=3469 RepID=A0A4Y7LC16_PAPSO|nr:hypothetical protein C5167_044315 [Papaver somniferum]